MTIKNQKQPGSKKKANYKCSIKTINQLQKLINTVVEKIIEFRGLLIINIGTGILKIPAMADTFDH